MLNSRCPRRLARESKGLMNMSVSAKRLLAVALDQAALVVVIE